jgi:hypothetical protein
VLIDELGLSAGKSSKIGRTPIAEGDASTPNSLHAKRNAKRVSQDLMAAAKNRMELVSSSSLQFQIGSASARTTLCS